MLSCQSEVQQKPASDISTLIIGCGNLLRGDDAAGPIAIRRLWQQGLPAGVRCADGGTGGMDVAFQMRGVPHVVLIDASATDSEPGTLYEVPGENLEQLPPLSGINPHAFRWDHALAFGRWLLKDEYPERVTVYLIEGQDFNVGEDLSEPVSLAIDRLIERLMQQLGSVCPADAMIELTQSGYMQLSDETARRYFPDGVLVAFYRNGTLILMPTRGAAAGGLLLKQKNVQGDRCLLLSELFHFTMPVGSFQATWNERLGALEVPLPDRS